MNKIKKIDNKKFLKLFKEFYKDSDHIKDLKINNKSITLFIDKHYLINKIFLLDIILIHLNYYIKAFYKDLYTKDLYNNLKTNYKTIYIKYV